MPAPTVVSVPSDAFPRDKVEVVVVGGGIVGASTALGLARRGIPVAVCEKGRFGAEQSSRNWGWVRNTLRDPREVPLMIAAQRIWETMGTLVGRNTGYQRSGILIPRHNAGSERKIEHWMRVARDFDIPVEWLARPVLQARVRHAVERWSGGLMASGDGYAEPERATAAIAEGARDYGARLLSNCAVRGIETQAGAVSGVVTEHGCIPCSTVVIAGGVWSHLLAHHHGIDIPQLNVLNTVLRTTPVKGGPEPVIWHDYFGLRRRADGGFTVANGLENIVDITPRSFRYAAAFLPAICAEWRGLSFRFGRAFFDEALRPRQWSLAGVTPFEKTRILDPRPSMKGALSALRSVKKAFPELAAADIAQSWAGYLDVTPDAIPIISDAPKIPGLFVATGFSGHGFGIAPGAGELMANLITGEMPVVSPHAFRLSRFGPQRPNKIR